MLTSRLCVVHCLPSAIRWEESIVPDAFWSCAELRDPNATLSAIDTAQTRTGLALCLTVLTNDPPRAEPFYPRFQRFSAACEICDRPRHIFYA